MWFRKKKKQKDNSKYNNFAFDWKTIDNKLLYYHVLSGKVVGYVRPGKDDMFIAHNNAYSCFPRFIDQDSAKKYLTTSVQEFYGSMARLSELGYASDRP